MHCKWYFRGRILRSKEEVSGRGLDRTEPGRLYLAAVAFDSE